jgi:hypothetical protein
MCPYTTIYVSSYYYICFLILLICVLILLYVVFLSPRTCGRPQLSLPIPPSHSHAQSQHGRSLQISDRMRPRQEKVTSDFKRIEEERFYEGGHPRGGRGGRGENHEMNGVMALRRRKSQA